MTTLYKPVLIESAEQAEALPIGTVAIGPNHYAATRIEFGLGWSVTGVARSNYHDYVVGWSALVPIEAEERKGYIGGKHSKTRYVTPWQATS